MEQKFEISQKVEKYKNPWLVVNEYAISRNGKPGMYGVIERQDSVTIIARTEDGRTLFVKQYRFPTEAYSWELPMGGVDEGESPAAAAARELKEETGFTGDLSRVGSFHPIPGLTPQKASVFSVSIPNEMIAEIEDFDESVDEIVSRRLLSRQAVVEMLETGEISDGLTLCSLALLELKA